MFSMIHARPFRQRSQTQGDHVSWKVGRARRTARKPLSYYSTAGSISAKTDKNQAKTITVGGPSHAIMHGTIRMLVDMEMI